jgi:hypothetical protein
MPEILMNDKVINVPEKLAVALVKMKKATYVAKVEQSEESEEKPKRTYKTKVLKADEE